MFYAYAIASISRHYIYVGHTQELIVRLEEHNSRNDKANSPYRPFRMVYYEAYKTRKEAVNAEKKLKKAYCKEWLKKIAYYKDYGEIPKWLKGRVC